VVISFSYHAEALARGIVLVGAELLMRSSHLFCHCTNEHFPTYSVWLSDKEIRNCTFVLTKGKASFPLLLSPAMGMDQ